MSGDACWNIHWLLFNLTSLLSLWFRTFFRRRCRTYGSPFHCWILTWPSSHCDCKKEPFDIFSVTLIHRFDFIDKEFNDLWFTFKFIWCIDRQKYVIVRRKISFVHSFVLSAVRVVWNELTKCWLVLISITIFIFYSCCQTKIQMSIGRSIRCYKTFYGASKQCQTFEMMYGNWFLKKNPALSSILQILWISREYFLNSKYFNIYEFIIRMKSYSIANIWTASI